MLGCYHNAIFLLASRHYFPFDYKLVLCNTVAARNKRDWDGWGFDEFGSIDYIKFIYKFNVA
jgi:hypothetical protein